MNHQVSMNKEEFASMFAHSLEKRPQFLKILSMNHYDMEANSRPDQLVAFKAVYGQSMHVVRSGLDKYFPQMSEVEKQTFIYTFFPFLFGVYPYTFVTEKQKIAMEKGEVNYIYFTWVLTQILWVGLKPNLNEILKRVSLFFSSIT